MDDLQIIKESIENNDTEALFDLWDIYASEINENSTDNRESIIYNYLYNKLAPLAKDNNLTYSTQFLDDCNSKLDILLSNFKEPKTIDDCYQLETMANNILTKTQYYMAEFLPYPEEFDNVLNNPNLLSEREIQQQYLENYSPIDLNPFFIFEHDEDGWLIEDSKRLETEEECKARVDKELARRQEYLAQFSNSKDDSVAKLQKWWDFINILPKLTQIRKKCSEIYTYAKVKENEIKLKNFKDDAPFYNDVLNIMEHDEHEYIYLYHGTQCIEDADAIVEKGLYMVSEYLSSTTYYEFTPEQLLLYHRGFGGEIGNDAVVIIKIPIKSLIKGQDRSSVVKVLDTPSTDFAQSGLAGLNSSAKYIIPKEYIVGYVNKRDHKIVYGEGYTIDNPVEV